MMKLSTLSSINFDTPDLFNFFRSEEQPEKFYLIGQDVRIFEIKFTPNCQYLDGPYFKMQYLKAPKTRPTKKLINNNNMITFYQGSNILNRQTLSIDPLFAAEFSEANIEPVAQHICWPKSKSFNKDLVAVVTNFGQCEILELNDVTRTYEKTLFSINEMLKEMFPCKVVNNFEGLKNIIENNVVTTCCWINTDINVLVFATICGLVFATEIKESQGVRLISKIKTNIYKICQLKSFQFTNDKNEFCNGLIVSNITGLISLYQFQNDELKELCVLWHKEDKMSSKQFDVYFEEDKMELIITTIKGYHFLVFVVSTKTWEVVYKGNEFCTAQISNFYRFNKFEYILSTIIGQTKFVTLSKSKDKCLFRTVEIPNSFEIENYAIAGMAPSRNKIAWIFIMCPDKKYLLNSNRQRHASSLCFCTLDNCNPLQILKQYDRKYNDAKHFTDCYEIMRLQLLKNPTINNLNLYDFNPITLDFNLIHRLRIRYNIVNSIVEYNMKKTKSCNENLEIEICCIKLSIKAIYAFWRLLRIKKDLENLSDFQKLSGKCLQRMLKNYITKEILKNTLYDDVKEILTIISKDTLSECENFFENILEICNFCGLNTDETHEKCLHDIGRCCISDVQISSLSMKYCEGCGDIAINDDELLKQVQIDEHDYRCPICDYLLIQ